MPAPTSDEPDTGPSVSLTVTPRDYRRQGTVFLALGLLVLGFCAVMAAVTGRDGPVLLGLVAVGYGLWAVVQGRRGVTRVVVRVDRSGIRYVDRGVDRDWSGVVMVWVGSSTGLRLPALGQATLSFYTAAGVDFAGRVGSRPSALFSVPVGGVWDLAGLCARLRAVTDADVVDGSRVSRRAAAAALAEGRRP